MPSPWGKRWGPDRGSVTAELAMALPAVVLVLGCCLAAVQVTGQQVRLTDAAADAARSLSRGDEAGRAAGLVAQAVSGASLGTENRGEFVCAHLSAPSAFGPFALFGLTLEASSCALAGGL
nr:TadE family type IV pilus minor pilin [Glaciibacter superstes]